MSDGNDAAAATSPADDPVAEPARQPQPGFFEAVADRLNPILVREVQQVTAGRMLIGLMALALVGVMAVAIRITGETRHGDRLGETVFQMVTSGLVILAVFAIPVQSYQSMRAEVQAGVGDQLALTRLGPTRIVLGKAMASFLVFGVLLSIAAPLLALSYLLRGIDVFSIVLVIAGVALLSLLCNLFAIAGGAVAKTRLAKSIVQFLLGIGLLVFGVQIMGALVALPGGIGGMVSSWNAILGLLSVFFWLAMAGLVAGMIATAALAHEYENRSSRFRVFALFGAIAAQLTALVSPFHPFYELSTMTAALTAPIVLVACSERPTLSPRVRAHVTTRWPWLAAPLLPGAPRGVVFTFVLAVVSLGLAALFETGVVVAIPKFGNSGLSQPVAAWCYVLTGGWVAAMLRRSYGDSPKGTMRTVTFMVVLFLGGLLATVGIRVLASVPSWNWTPLDMLNPFLTVVMAEKQSDAFGGALLVGVLGLIGTALSVRPAVREVLRASAARRARDRELVDSGLPTEGSVA